MEYNLWRCNLNPKDAKEYAASKTDDEFWISVLTSWSKYNYTESLQENQSLWLNSNIRIGGKPVWWPQIYCAGLFWIQQLVRDGAVLTEEEARKDYGMTTMQYNSLISAIPKTLVVNAKQGCLAPETDKYTEIIMCQHPTKKIYTEFICDGNSKNIYSKCKKWTEDLKQPVTEKELTTAINKIQVITNVPKYRSFQYRLLHRAIITNVHLFHWGIKSSAECTFCDLKRETTVHLFLECERVQRVWTQLHSWLKQNFDVEAEDPTDLKRKLLCERDCVLTSFVYVVFCQYVYRQRCLKERLSVNEIINTVVNIEKTERYIATKNCKLVKHFKKWRDIDREEDLEKIQTENIDNFIQEYLEEM